MQPDKRTGLWHAIEEYAARIAFLHARLDEDEQTALNASRRDEANTTPTGEHWRWEDTEHDHVLNLDPAHELVHEGADVGLRSTEQYPTHSVGDLPHFVIPCTQEMRTTDALHIARWDPARVLAEIAAKRRILALEPDGDHGGYPDGYSSAKHEALALLALPYADHPDYREQWRPS